jgi:transposase
MPAQIQQHWLSPMGSNAVNPTILLAIELSASTWLVAARAPGLEKPHLHRIDGRDTAALLALISSLRARAARGLDATIGVVCCFEAGRDSSGCTVC